MCEAGSHIGSTLLFPAESENMPRLLLGCSGDLDFTIMWFGLGCSRLNHAPPSSSASGEWHASVEEV